MAKSKVRLDDYLIAIGRFPERDSVMRAVLAGEVQVDGAKARSAAQMIASQASVSVADGSRFVSRGGEKLARALDAFSFDPAGMSCVDCGASTGGFTDCLLQHGARSVCAIDVGYGQFAWKLRQDPRVSLFERTNLREVDAATVGAPFDLAVADMSFAPLRSWIDSVVALLGDGASFITLVKPQFEVARGQVGHHGVVSDEALHVVCVSRAVDLFVEKGFSPRGLTFSSIKGPMGNIEYLLLGTRGAAPISLDVAGVVASSHEALDPDGRGLAETSDDAETSGSGKSAGDADVPGGKEFSKKEEDR